jgi:hypothetical protein
MPKSSLKRQEFNQKKPYLVASVFCLILIVFAFGFFYGKEADEKQKALDLVKPEVDKLKRDDQRLRAAIGDMRKIQAESENFFAWMEDRYRWSEVLTVLRDSLITLEDKKQKEFSNPTGVWIEKFEPITPPGYLTVGSEAARAMHRGTDGGAATPAPTPTGRGRRGGGGGGGAAAGGGTNQIDTVLLTCRSVNMKAVKAGGAADDAHTVIAEGLAEELRGRTNHFIADGTRVTGDIQPPDTNLTFTFQVTLKLARPVKL